MGQTITALLSKKGPLFGVEIRYVYVFSCHLPPYQFAYAYQVSLNTSSYPNQKV